MAWQMIKSPAIGSAEVSNATYEWFFSGGNPETVAAKNNMLTNPITYATSGEKTAVLTFTPNNGSSVTIECSPLQVTESTTASSSSVPFSSSVHSSSSSIDACNDEMPVSKGSGIALSGNTEAPIGNTPWNIRQWYANGNASLTYYANGTFKANWNNGSLRWNEETSLWELCPERLLVANGPRHIPYGITAELDGNLLRITCPDAGLYDMRAVPDDQLLVAVYLPDISAVMLYRGPMRDRCFQCTFELPTEMCASGALMYVYAWFCATSFHRASGSKSQVRPDQSSPSRHLGIFHL